METNKNILRTLDGGLTLRRSTVADAEKLAEFNQLIHGEGAPQDSIGQWTRDLLERPHPTFGEGDFTIVEEQESGRIVSSLNLISQTWNYEGIPFKLGRPELVGTLPEYRSRGLVRAQFEEIHCWSRERGELAQAITGIPYYYRLFGYEMCVDLDGSRSGFEMNLPKLAEGKAETYRFRPAEKTDVAFISAVYQRAAKRSLLTCARDEAIWEYEISGKSARNINRVVWEIIERTDDGQLVGYLGHPWFAWGVTCPAVAFEITAGASWLEVTHAAARHLWELGAEICAGEGKTRQAFTFGLAGSHPVYEVMRDNLPRKRNPYSWFMRVEDLPGFLRHIAPVLEDRLAASFAAGWSGELKLNFYKSGLRLVFEQGKMLVCEAWQPSASQQGDATFPDLTFLQLLFGHRSLDELDYAFTDCFWNNDVTRVLLSSLFPRKPSQLLGIS